MKAIIFDFFGVINSDTGTVWLKKNIHNDEVSTKLRSMFTKVDIGDTPESEFFKIASGTVGRSAETVRNEWFELSHINPQVLQLISDLKKKYLIALCTNAPSALVRDIIDKTGISNYFDEIFISSELRMIKPAPEIFKFILNKLDIQPDQAIFIDDSITNVKGAEQVGIKSIQFKDADQLESDLALFLK